MQHRNRELWLAFFAILVITGLYLLVVAMLGGIPGASGFFGHSIGILGFVLMLMTETLYSYRKRSRTARWGRMSEWLNFHIFTGIVGPYLVLLHSSWKFNGLAGIVMLLTVVIVASGFLGRYIYTAVPRTADGIEVEAGQLERLVQEIQAELERRSQAQPEATRDLLRNLAQLAPEGGHAAGLILERPVMDLSWRLRWWLLRRSLHSADRAQLDQLGGLLRRQQVLRRQVASLAAARRLLSLWHSVHIPIGMMLFTAAFIHILAAIYFATMLR